VFALFLLSLLSSSIDSHINSIDNSIESTISSTVGSVVKARAENVVPQVTTYKSDSNHFSSLQYAKKPTIVTLNNGNDISDRATNARSAKLTQEKEKSLVKEDRSEDNLNNIMQQHQIPSFTNEIYDNKQEENNKNKKKGGLTSIGGTVGEIIGALISEVVKLFGDLVGDVAREITAHGFVEFIRSITGYTPTNENIKNINLNTNNNNLYNNNLH